MLPEPGQFFMVQTGPSRDPLLKRPFCVFDADSQEIAFLIRVRGRGTALISRLAPGSIIEVLGPLGTPYPFSDKRPLVAVGGIGIASVFPLIKRLSGRVTVLYGARTSRELLFADEIRKYARELHVTTDDGSAGRKGCVTDYFPEFIREESDAVVFSCGPGGMLEIISEQCRGRNIECYLSLEENMACGIGSCQGCAVKTREGYKRVCKEGPVFSAHDIVWEKREKCQGQGVIGLDESIPSRNPGP
jgi:dihydroorotate dehydrogenase electron transfer subunit